jgi:hypothetical protein
MHLIALYHTMLWVAPGMWRRHRDGWHWERDHKITRCETQPPFTITFYDNQLPSKHAVALVATDRLGFRTREELHHYDNKRHEREPPLKLDKRPRPEIRLSSVRNQVLRSALTKVYWYNRQGGYRAKNGTLVKIFLLPEEKMILKKCLLYVKEVRT